MQRPRTTIALDFETFFDQKYSLRSKTLSTTQYIRSPDFHAHCVGIRSNRQRKAKWFPHEKIASALARFDWSKTALLAHNCAFDAMILSHHYGIVPAYYYDSMSMARALYSHAIGVGLNEVARYLGYAGKLDDGAALLATKGIHELPKDLLAPLGRYCAQDVDATVDIFRALLPGFPVDELDLIHLTINAYANPVLRVDHKRAHTALERELAHKSGLFSRAAEILATDTQPQTCKLLSSNQQFPAALTALGVEAPTKVSLRTGKVTYALARNDLDFQALTAHPDARVRTLVAARLAAKSTIGETRAQRLLEHGKKPHRLPIALNYCRAHTMRWSGGDKMNPQNFKRGGELRKSIIAPRGYQLVVVDSGQIEARMLAWLAGQDDLLETFRAGGDPYCDLATEIYRRPITKADKAERFVGKCGILMCGFGAGAEKFQQTLAAGSMGPPVSIELDAARLAISTYRRKHWKIVYLWRSLQAMLGKLLVEANLEYRCLRFHQERIAMPNGLSLHYPQLQFSPQHGEYAYRNGTGMTKIYGAKLAENIVQCLARIVVGQQMLKIMARYRIVTMSHDECVYLAKTREAKMALKFGLTCFATPPDWCADLPCIGEGGFDRAYSK